MLSKWWVIWRVPQNHQTSQPPRPAEKTLQLPERLVWSRVTALIYRRADLRLLTMVSSLEGLRLSPLSALLDDQSHLLMPCDFLCSGCDMLVTALPSGQC